MKLIIKRITVFALLVALVLSTTAIYASAYETCVPDKQHLNGPNSKVGKTWIVNIWLDKCGTYTINWDHAICYARAIFPTDVGAYPSLSDSGRVWANGYSQATAYGKGTLTGKFGHDCSQSY